jgi:hypothetical protein
MPEKGESGTPESTPRAGAAQEGLQSYQAPPGDAAEEKAPSSMGQPEPEHVEASLHPKPKE